MTIGRNVAAIGSKAFYNCSALTALTILSKMEKIGNREYKECSSLKTIQIKTTLLTTKTVSEDAFSGIPASTVIKVPESRSKTDNKTKRRKLPKAVGSPVSGSSTMHAGASFFFTEKCTV